jgi:hypothetical protein
LSESDASAWQLWQQQAQAKRNQMQWALRNFLRWTPGEYRENPSGKEFINHLPHPKSELAKILLARYGLSDLPDRASDQRVLETLTYLDWLDGLALTAADWLDALFRKERGANHSVVQCEQTLSWLDVGAKNWSYVEALSGFIQNRHESNFQLHGIELDPMRRYTNLHTREQAAQAFIQRIPQATYHVGDALAWQQPVHVISLFLPFVFVEPHLAWGLPLPYFQPQALLEHLVELLEPGGLLIIVNQGKVEAEAQGQLLQNMVEQGRLEIQNLEQLPTRFIDYQYPRFGWLCRKIDA